MQLRWSERGRPHALASVATGMLYLLDLSQYANIGSCSRNSLVGGSLGTVRVGEGLWDASIEVPKGFRPWDFMPGAFIAQGAGAYVIDLQGNPIDFGAGIIKDQWVQARFEGEALEDCRQKFIVAATEELAHEILTVVQNQEIAEQADGPERR